MRRALIITDELFDALQRRGIVERLNPDQAAELILRKALGLRAPPPERQAIWPPVRETRNRKGEI